MSLLGARVRRAHDPRLLTGRGAYVDDLKLSRPLHMAVWRSPMAHARIAAVDLSGALALPGVVDAFDISAFGQNPPTFPVIIGDESLKPCPQTPLACERVRHVGEGVAVVVAESRAIAEDALERIRVDLEPFAAVASVDAALAAGAVVLHDTAPGNVAAAWTTRLGDADSAFARADLVVEQTLTMQRYTGVPIETRGVAAVEDPVTGELVMYVSGQWPHTARTIAAQLLSRSPERIRVVVPDVGGGFGVKEEFYPEDILVAVAAQRSGRAVKWVEDRREHFSSVVHARQQTHHIAVALRRDGTITGLRDRILTDMGAYVRALGFVNPSLTAASVPGPYRIPNIAIESVAVLTNKTPVSPYRGAGQPEATYARERLLDIAAERLSMDPIELRQRNLIHADALPLDTGISSVDGPVVFDSGDFQLALRRASDLIRTASIRAGGPSNRAPEALVGVGVAVYAQITGTGPFEGADVRVTDTGEVTVVTGAVDIGQGLTTALAQIVADELGIGIDRVRVVCGDTARIPHGVGTYASRAAVMAGNAAANATRQVRRKAIAAAAHVLEVAPDDIEWVDGVARVRGAPGRELALADIAAALAPGHRHRRGADLEPTLESRHYYENEHPPFAYGVHAVLASIDPETGAVHVDKYVVVSDAGRLINPTIAEGQIVGGIAQGLGGALLEDLRYDDDGQLVASSLLDYAIPRATDIPNVDMVHLEIPSPLNPLGIKGLGEGGAVGAHAAVANAVADALRPLGVTVCATPLTALAVRDLIRTAQRTETTLTAGDAARTA